MITKTLYVGPDDFLEAEKNELTLMTCYTWLEPNEHNMQIPQFSTTKPDAAYLKNMGADNLEQLIIKYTSVLNGGVNQPTLVHSNPERIINRLYAGNYKKVE